MKRPRSYGEDLDGDGRDKGRRFYLKVDDRQLRRRAEHDGEGSGGLGFDRRKGGFDRYRDTSSSSPRGLYGSERMHRSESFNTGLRRDFFPKGFRSERDRHRRDASTSGFSWRRFGAKESGSNGGDESDSVRERIRRKESSSGEHSRRLETGKESTASADDSDSVSRGRDSARESRRLESLRKVERSMREKESFSSSEMEEGELEPEPEPEPESKPELKPEPKAEALDSADARESVEIEPDFRKEREVDSSGGSVSMSGNKDPEQSERKSEECHVESIKESEEKLEREVGGKEEETDEVTVARELSEKEQEACKENEKQIGPPISDSLDQELEPNQRQRENEKEIENRVVNSEAERQEEREEQTTDLNLESETNKAVNLVPPIEGEALEDDDNNCENFTLNLMSEKPRDKDKGKGLALSASSKDDSFDTTNEGPSFIGMDLLFRSERKTENCGIVIGKKEKDVSETLTDRLDLSLSLAGTGSKIKDDQNPKNPIAKPNSLSFCTNSEGYTASVSVSSSQPFVHNPSCSLNQNSLDNNNYEQSVASRPLFQPVSDPLTSGVSLAVWPAQPSNETKRIDKTTPLINRSTQNGNHNTNTNANANANKVNGLGQNLSFNNRSGVIEKVLSKIVSEPLHLSGRMLQEMRENSISYLKEAICEMVTNLDKTAQVTLLQESLKRRPDLTIDNLPKCPRTLLEILLVLKTGRPEYIRKSKNVTVSELAEIYLDLKCRNLSCRNVLPVDDCECNVCKEVPGFCSACMCIVCSRFDSASNTCGWVGCDVCLHWCHTDCGLRKNLIRNGKEREMNFYCSACGHPSEMLGFVKEVFRTCAKEWKAENLGRELKYVRRIFESSEDLRGRRLRDLVERMIGRLEERDCCAEVVGFIMGFFSESESNANTGSTSTPPLKELVRYSFPRQTSELGPQKTLTLQNKPAIDELDRLVKLKQAEARLYQDRSDEARREAEGLKRISLSKSARIKEEYSIRVNKLRVGELEERRKRKLEELQAMERSYQQFFSMKVRMETDIRDLMMKMESAKHNFSM